MVLYSTLLIPNELIAVSTSLIGLNELALEAIWKRCDTPT